jgi:predicted naringenin-chalcone synthase
LHIAAALPGPRREQRTLAAQLATLWGLRGEALRRWERIIEQCGIEWRHAVRDPEEVLPLRTEARMALFAEEAPALAEQAARRVLDECGVAAPEVTDLVIVTCTGFRAPGVDVALVDRLGLPMSVRRVQVGFMGCFGAITGLRTAAGACCADRGAVALLVCLELCSLHARADSSAQNQVCSALFGDAAVAALVVGPRWRPARGRGAIIQAAGGPAPKESCPVARGRQLGLGTTGLLPAGRDAMTWTITDNGFAMTLSQEVPAALRRSVARLVEEQLAGPAALPAVHPGGRAILDLLGGLLEPAGERALAHARGVLRAVGNVSSGTVLLVAQRLMAESAAPIVLLAFGPGLTVETLDLGRGPADPPAQR